MMEWVNYGHYIFKGLYRADYFRDILFPLESRWEDVIWSGEVVGGAGKYAYVLCDLYSCRISDTSLVHTWTWVTQRQYFSPMLTYVSLARKYTQETAVQVELLAYEALIERYCVLSKNLERFTREQKADIVQCARRCGVTIEDPAFGFLLRCKLVILLSLISFPYACDLKLKLIH